MARPRKKIDAKQVEKLAAIDCSYAEMAAVLGCDPSTLTRRFAQAIERGRARGCSSLKRKQFQLAMKGDRTMLVWLGKIRLGQQETIRSELTGKDGGPIEVADGEAVRTKLTDRLSGLANRITPAAPANGNGNGKNGHR